MDNTNNYSAYTHPLGKGNICGIRKFLTTASFILVCLYIIMMYNAQEMLLPPIIHSATMYIMIGVTAIQAFLTKSFIFSKFSVWYLLILCIGVLSYIFFLDSDVKILYPILVSFIISYCYIQNIRHDSQIDTISKFYVLAAILMSFQIWWTGELARLIVISSNEGGRLGGDITGNANIFSALFMYSGVFAAWLAIYSKNKKQQYLFILALAIILLFMALSGGRKTIVAVLASLVCFLLCKSSGKRKINIIIYCIASIIAIGIIIWLMLNIPFLYDHVGERFEDLIQMMMGKSNSVGSDDLRRRMIGMAFEGWLDKPLLGHGIDSFKYYNLSKTGNFFYSHNNYVELLYDVGIVGFIAYYSMYYYIGKQLILKVLSKGMKSHSFSKYHALGLGLLVELLIFDVGGISYYLVGNIVILAIAYLCVKLKT